METDQKTGLERLCENMEIQVTFTEPDRSDPKFPMLKMKVTLKHEGRTIECDYGMGVGHIRMADRAMRLTSLAGEGHVKNVLKHSVGFTATGVGETENTPHTPGSPYSPPLFTVGQYRRCLPSVKAADVLACLIMDAQSWSQTNDVDDYVATYGFSITSLADARKIERNYEACAKIHKQLDAFLGKDREKFEEAASSY